MADADVHVATIVKNSREQLRIALSEFKGHNLISLRVFYEAEDGSWRPSKSGLAMKVEKLPDLIEALQKAQRAAEASG